MPAAPHFNVATDAGIRPTKELLFPSLQQDSLPLQGAKSVKAPPASSLYSSSRSASASVRDNPARRPGPPRAETLAGPSSFTTHRDPRLRGT
ncbi:hypothetical protein CBM2609_A70503 [Cupriavidus taiwanensis]|nr:hypothetical protein CBM2604_A60501 [Cupriavidus taiwanensis]SOZ29210.1 hypothetical protein CBM2609_A70503 [Cupriavidus taiwanensis]SOZ46674.1 hypothetical protein CBM2610_A80461 [Cupriavidus taiwanensis]